jgi:hypothetical protein
MIDKAIESFAESPRLVKLCFGEFIGPCKFNDGELANATDFLAAFPFFTGVEEEKWLE